MLTVKDKKPVVHAPKSDLFIVSLWVIGLAAICFMASGIPMGLDGILWFYAGILIGCAGLLMSLASLYVRSKR
jgi:hypothetical protein